MGSLGGDDDVDVDVDVVLVDGVVKVKSNKKNNPNVNILDTDRVHNFDFQLSSPHHQLSDDVFQNQTVDFGGETQVLDDFDCIQNLDLQMMQSTVPFGDDAIPLEDGTCTFQTQVVNCGGETQILDDPHLGDETLVFDDPDLGGETQAVDDFYLGGETQAIDDYYLGGESQVVEDFYLGGETQLLNDPYLGGETQVVDDPDGVDNLCTQLINDSDCKVVVVDSEGEGTDRTEVLSDTEELSDDDSIRTIENCSVHQENIHYASPRKEGEKRLMEVTDTLIVQHCNPEIRVTSATPLDQGTLELKSGSMPMGFTSVRAASLRAAGLEAAVRSRVLKETNSESCYILNNSHSSKQLDFEDDGISGTRDMPKKGEEFDHRGHHSWEGEKVEEVQNRVVSSTVRRLFFEDPLSENKGFTNNINDAEGGSDLPQLPAHDNELAGLSYVDSQEPGDLSQVNALDFVDRFLEVNVLESDQGVNHGQTCRGNSNPVSVAKGSRSLAKTAKIRTAGGESQIFDWDDSREDEGGGAFFCRKKEEIFSRRGRGQKSFTLPRKLKASGSNQFKDEEERSNILDKTMNLVHSDERLALHKLKENGKTSEAAEKKIERNLVKELDGEANVIFLGEPSEAFLSMKDRPDMQDVGFDTQVAAEAMEELCNGDPLANQDANIAHQSSQNIIKGSGLSKNASEQHSFQKRATRSASGTVAGQSKKTERNDVKSSKESLVCVKKRSNHVRKQIDVDLVKEYPKRTKSNNKEHFTTHREIQNRMPSKITEQRQKEVVSERSRGDELDRSHNSAALSGRVSVKRQCIQDKIGTVTPIPIAKRTRQGMLQNQLNGAALEKNESTEEMNVCLEAAVTRDKRKRNDREVDDSKLSNTKNRTLKMGLTISGEVGNVKLNHHEKSNAKVIAKTDAASIDGLNFPKRRRTCRNFSGQIKQSSVLNAPSKLSIRRDADGQCSTKQESKRYPRSTSVDFNMRRTRSSVYSFKDMDKNSDGRLPLQIPYKSGSRCAVLDSDSTNFVVNPKNMIAVEASKQSDRLADATVSSAEGTETNARLEVSPIERCKQSDSVCITPDYCRTSTNDASPVCMGNEYFKQSCKKNLSRSCLMKELNSIIGSVPEPVSASKESRKRRDIAHVRALFSHHLDEDIIKHQKKILVRLGASVASCISDATHFITDEFVRTRNILEAIASGKPVVTHLWLESCNQTSCFIDEKNYILRDVKKEKEFSFSMPVSLARACQHPLLQNRRVLITPNTKPGKNIIATLVKAVHGQAVERIGRSALKDDKVPDDLLVLSCEEDYAICVPFLEKGAAVYSSELLLNGIVTQRLEYQRHRLFEDHVKRTRSTIWMRKDGNKFLPVTTKCK